MNRFKFFTGVSILAFLTLCSPNLSLAMEDKNQKDEKNHIPAKQESEDDLDDLDDLLNVFNKKIDINEDINQDSPSKNKNTSDTASIPKTETTTTSNFPSNLFILQEFSNIISSPSSPLLESMAPVFPSVPVTLVRINNNDVPLVRYAQKLMFAGRELKLNRRSTEHNIEYVKNASLNDGRKTHLLVQSVCKTETQINDHKASRKLFKTNIAFPEITPEPNIPIDWVSHSSTTTPEGYYPRKAISFENGGQRGGHSEPQLISDFNAKFVQNADDLVDYFMPKETDTSNVYMCGLELFGPYDMCDKFNGGNNKYNCVGQLKAFRGNHQNGQQSISQAIRDRLGDRFQGVIPEDAFVVIYHAKYPYESIYTYHSNNNDKNSPIKYSGIFDNNFNINDDLLNKDHFIINNTHELSQCTEINTAPDDLYGYIHHLGNKSIQYNGSFKFPEGN